MAEIPEIVDGLPNIAGAESAIDEAATHQPVFLPDSDVDMASVTGACAIALHMHQPLIPAGGDDLSHARIIGNLQYMMEHQDIGDNHNAPVFRRCYQRMGEIVPELLGEGKAPRVMLDYSGTLLFGLRQMGADDVLEALAVLACNADYRGSVEWLGGPWGHAVAPSTPVQDYRLHVRAWRHHFAALFGLEALDRVRGFSPAEMALPNHPDVAYEFVRTLLDCGYQWLLVQEHSVEHPEDGAHPHDPHVPHRLVCTNAAGDSAEIVAIVKTQGSDTKLVGQMQPYYEAAALKPRTLAGHRVPPLVTQIADGENGGVMMNEFPPKYREVVRAASGNATPLLNVTEYLEHLDAAGVQAADFEVLQPVMQKPIWERFEPGAGSRRLEQVIDSLRKEDDRFHMEGGSWTNNLSWIRGYESLLGPMEEISALFYEKVLEGGVATDEPRYRNALFHLLCSQTSCYRYWGEGIWTDYGREICRRARHILTHDF